MPLVNKSFSEIITFTRASGGGRFNAQGQYEWLPANQPRFDFDPVTGEAKGLLIEEQRTNLLTYSSDFANAVWTKASATVTGGVQSPDAGSGASRVQTTVVNATSPARAVSNLTVAGATYTYSVWLRADTPQRLLFQVPTPSYGSYLATKSIAVTQAWQRFDITFTGQAGALWIRADATGTVYDIWGAQLEASSTPTSYIPTTTAQVTRAADVAVVNTLSPWYRTDEGTLFVEAVPAFGSDSRGLVSLYSSVANRLTIFRQATTLEARWYNTPGIPDRGGVVPILNYERAKIALAWTAGGDRAISANGAQPSIRQVVGGPNMSAFTTLALMHSYGPVVGELSGGHIRSIRYFPKRLSNTELQSLTAN